MRNVEWPPPISRYTDVERALIERMATPEEVQRWLTSLPYNHEPDGETVRAFRGVVEQGTAHCLEAALSAAAILEQHGHAPRLLDLESADGLDHVLYLFERDARWGTVGRSREPGLHGRRPVFENLEALVDSYVDPYIDDEALIVGWATLDLRNLARGDWRWSRRNVWHVERALTDKRHRRVRISRARRERVLSAYRSYRRRNPDRQPVTIYGGRETWMGWRVPPGLQAKG